MGAAVTTTAIRGVLGPTGTRGTVVVDGGRIAAVLSGDDTDDTDDAQTYDVVDVVDLGDAIVGPGLVDLQVNGIGAIDFATAREPTRITHALDALTRHGTTACLPTIVTAPLRQYDAMLDCIRAARDAPDAARRCAVLGVHLEGPFLGGAPGAHPRDLVRDVDLRWLQQRLRRDGDLIRMVTLAPESDPDLAATRMLHSHGVVVSIGHSSASYDEAIAAADAGATVVTHLFNSMSGLHHRSPGMVGAALIDDRLTPTVIPDLVHVHPAALRVAFAATDRVVAITDAVAPGAGASGGLAVFERDGAVYLDDGTLAGSVLTMDVALRNVVALGVPLPRAFDMTATAPCDLLGASDRGRLVAGARADLVVLDADGLGVAQVWVAGERIV
jgi:N-acetylglucosamine-6-phosphate deacetylase